MNIDHFMTLLEERRQAAIAAVGRKGQRATNKQSRQELQTILNSQRFRAGSSAAMHHERICFINHSYPPSTTLLSELEPITISDLRLETHHVGKVLVVRTFGHAIRVQSVSNIVEDSKGHADRLSLYNGDPKPTPEQLLPTNTIFAIKEPFYKATADKGYSIRVDHPSDLIQLHPFHEAVPVELAPRLIELEKAAVAWKTEGNAAFQKKDYLNAADSYTQGLLSNPDAGSTIKHDLLRNRAIAKFYLERYEGAFTDAIDSLMHGNSTNGKEISANVKARYRAGRSAYDLGRFSEARSQFKHVLRLDQEDADTKRELARTDDRLEEEATGGYNFTEMSKAANRKVKRLDYANFTSRVAVHGAGNRGRGLFAAVDIAAGDVILCEKAFCAAFDKDAGTEMYTILNLNTNRGTTGTQATLLFNIVQKLLHNPDQAGRFLDLFDGGYSPKCAAQVVDGVTAIDTFQIAAIIEHNAFGCPNARSTDKADSLLQDDDPRSATGIWITASYANHACDGNARRSFIGDMMIIRATKDIPKNEEILMPYRSNDPDCTERRSVLQKAWGFVCDCSICAAECNGTASRRTEREQLIQEAKSFLKSHVLTKANCPVTATINKAEALFSKLEKTYDKDVFKDVPRLGLAILQIWLCSAYSTGPAPQKVVNAAVGVLRNLGYKVIVASTLHVDRSHCSLDNMAIDAAMYASEALIQQGKTALLKQFRDFGRELYRTSYGTLEGFDGRYGAW